MPQRSKGKKTLKIVAAGEIRRAKSGSKLDEMLKGDSDDIEAFTKIGDFDDEPTSPREYFEEDEKKSGSGGGRATSLKSRYADTASKINAVRDSLGKEVCEINSNKTGYTSAGLQVKGCKYRRSAGQSMLMQNVAEQ